MTKKEFGKKIEEFNVLVKSHFKDEDFKEGKGMWYVILLQGEDQEKKVHYNNILSNVRITHILPFVQTIMNVASKVMGRQN